MLKKSSKIKKKSSSKTLPTCCKSYCVQMTYESSMPDKYADIDHRIVSNIELE